MTWLLKSEYFKGGDEHWRGVSGERTYIDQEIRDEKFNSYDSMDKYVMVLDFESPIDSGDLFKRSAESSLNAYSYNILSDAGFIPHFAYQSLVRYDLSDKNCGISHTWKNAYLKDKEHMQFELLGLDDKEIPKAYEQIGRMVVEDVTDECKTLICPTKLMEDIYRIWCEGRTFKRRALSGEDEDPYDSYFENEFAEYTNPELDFSTSKRRNDGSRVIEWDVCSHPENPMFQLDIPRSEQDIDDMEDGADKEQRKLDIFKSLLDEYYVYVMRTENGNVLNEKRYILKPTPVSEFLLGMVDDDGYIKCNLNKYQTSSVKDNHFVAT